MKIELNEEEKELLEYFLEHTNFESLGFEEDEVETLKGISEKLKNG